MKDNREGARVRDQIPELGQCSQYRSGGIGDHQYRFGALKLQSAETGVGVSMEGIRFSSEAL